MKFNTSHLKVMSTITCKFKKFSLSIKSSLDVLFRMLKIIFCFCFLLFFILISQCVTESFQSCLTLCDCQDPLSLGIFFSKNTGIPKGLLCSAPGDLPDPGIEPMSLTSPVLAGRFFTTSTIWEAQNKSEVSNYFSAVSLVYH